MSRASRPATKLVHIPRRPPVSQSQLERVSHDNFRNSTQVLQAVRRVRATVPLTPESLPDVLQRLADGIHPGGPLSDFQLVRFKRYGHCGATSASQQWRPQSRPAAFQVMDGHGRCVAALHPPPILPLGTSPGVNSIPVLQYLDACRNALPVAVLLGTMEELSFFVAQHHYGRSSSLVGSPVQLLSEEVFLRGLPSDSSGAASAAQQNHFDTFVQAIQSCADFDGAATWWYRLAMGVPELMTAAFERQSVRSPPHTSGETTANSSAKQLQTGISLEDPRWNCLPRERLLRNHRIVRKPMFLLGEMKYGVLDVYED